MYKILLNKWFFGKRIPIPQLFYSWHVNDEIPLLASTLMRPRKSKRTGRF